MRKPATPGMEGKKGVILQAHMDMVPQKSPESTHNFETDPIETYIDVEWVKAKGTTLGADNGIGVATIMAVMEDKTLKHGPVEALITADEETGSLCPAHQEPAACSLAPYGRKEIREGEKRTPPHSFSIFETQYLQYGKEIPPWHPLCAGWLAAQKG